MHLHSLSVHDNSLIQRLLGHDILESSNELELILIHLLNMAHCSEAKLVWIVVFAHEGTDDVLEG